MPYWDEEHPGQPLWQSVLLFCCKGMIEGIMVLLFFWLLVQVLFTKQLEVHLQILLLVGLVVFCLCLVLGCVLCWRSTRTPSSDDKERAPSGPPPPGEPAARPRPPPPAAAALSPPTAGRYEELDGDILECPSSLSSSAPSEDVFASLTSSPAGRPEPSGGYFSMRRLSTPQRSAPLYRPMDHSRASLSSFPGLGLLSRTRRVLERRCTVTGDQISCSERLRLTGAAAAPPAAEEPIPLAPLHYGSGLAAGPWIHFTVAFSPQRRALTVSVRSLTGSAYSLEEVWAEGSLGPGARQASGHAGLDPRGLDPRGLDPRGLELVLSVGSEEELLRCVLRLSLHTLHPPPRASGSLLGELEVQCADKDWRADHPIHFTKELNVKKCALKMRAPSLGAPLSKPRLSCSPQILAQLFILLQYQTLAHRVKATVLKVDQLATAGFQVVTKLHHEGVLICTKYTEGWNSPFLFDLPPGDLRHMHITLEIIVMQNQTTVLGRVLIGSEAPEAGRAHWREMCSQGQTERAQWHSVQPEPL